jgi:hypothetical protein
MARQVSGGQRSPCADTYVAWRGADRFPSDLTPGQVGRFVALPIQEQAEKTALCEGWNRRAVRIKGTVFMQGGNRPIHRFGSFGLRFPMSNQVACQNSEAP